MTYANVEVNHVSCKLRSPYIQDTFLHAYKTLSTVTNFLISIGCFYSHVQPTLCSDLNAFVVVQMAFFEMLSLLGCSRRATQI